MSLARLSRPLLRHPTIATTAFRCHPGHSTLVRALATAAPLNEDEDSLADSPTADSHELSQLKRPDRGGQDLSLRHNRLERAVRGKTEYGRQILDLQEQQQQSSQERAPYTDEEHTRQASTNVGRKKQRIFKGFVIPEAPKPPADDECCMSGCAVCVYDLYDEARRDYIHAIDNLRTNLDKMGVPEHEWPPDIRRKQSPPGPSPRPDVVLSAFEQFEKQLREKRERERREAEARSGHPSSGEGGRKNDATGSEGQYTTS
ncbi:hypothetical protein BN946_scf184921.g32 [Trametes cinnabarina]|uniref:Oxidoreductase-like domain-containing protein n=1 Tax=Pycnoporus cinnabarinus TaxID=5643 RepID=A0A060SNL8_PYCCI|nr:hypothetical protein BN946_scf184921.g32 [Trametes cinnabarina]